MDNAIQIGIVNFSSDNEVNFNYNRYISNENSDIEKFSEDNKEFYSLSLVIYFESVYKNIDPLAELKLIDKIKSEKLSKDKVYGEVLNIGGKRFPFKLLKYLGINESEEDTYFDLVNQDLEDEFIEKIVLTIFFTNISEVNLIYDFLNKEFKEKLNNSFSIDSNISLEFKLENKSTIEKIRNKFRRIEFKNNFLIINCIDSQDLVSIRDIFKKRWSIF